MLTTTKTAKKTKTANKAKNVQVQSTALCTVAAHTLQATSSKQLRKQAQAQAKHNNNSLSALLAKGTKTQRATVTLAQVQSTAHVVNSAGTMQQKRNLNVTTRKIAVFTSASTNTCFISTNLAYCTKTTQGALTHAYSDLKQQKAVAIMLNAGDMQLTLMQQEINIGSSLAHAKLAVYNTMLAQKYIMLCNMPKV